MQRAAIAPWTATGHVLDMSDEDPWLDLTAAAAATGLARETIRGRIRRGQMASRKGNDGKLLVQVPSGTVAGAVLDVSAELSDLRADLARAESERDAAIAIGEARVAALRELSDRLTHELVDVRREMAELRRPWWRRWLG